jgi:hypothetical protein
MIHCCSTFHNRGPSTFHRMAIAVWIVILFTRLCGFTAAAAPSGKPAAQGPAPANPALPTIFIAGDSTAANGSAGAIGWGRPFPAFLRFLRSE